MGAVYAGAIMTIIAYAGDDPTFGLPGISSDIDRTTTWSMMQATGYLGLSTWLKRGWTFQENYLSKRRLFFTEIGPVYRCKSSLHSEVTCDFAHGFDIMVEAIIDNQRPQGVPTDLEAALHEAGNIMQSYSDRQLSYETDLLNAIVGVLNTLSTRQFPVRHIWGVPFTTGKTADSSIVKIALDWSSKSPGTRRSAFPSWSTLGWTSGSSRLSTPYSCSEEFNLEIWQNNKFQNISEIEDGYQDAHCKDPESRRLQITAYSVLLDASLWIKPVKGQYDHQIILPGTDNFGFYAVLHWDDEQHALKPDSSVLCVFQSALPHRALILECHGKYYERVGCFAMDEKLDLSLFQHCTEELCDQSLPSGSEATVASKSGLIQRRTIELR